MFDTLFVFYEIRNLIEMGQETLLKMGMVCR